MAGVSLRNVVKNYGALKVVHGASLDIAHGEFVVFVGPSGCGKSTLLRMIAGLEKISGGEIAIDGNSVNNVPARDRGVAMVFQNYALYPHMTVSENMSFALSNIGTPKTEIESRVKEAAEILQITKLLDRKPKNMSGGQRQRVAIGRAIVRKPKVFLFDEPLSNLDAALRVQMRTELAKLHHSLDATIIYVTHDQTEAMTMADRIVVLRDGNIEQVGAPLDLYRWPRNVFVAGFLGSPKMNLIAGKVLQAEGHKVAVECAGGAIVAAQAKPNSLSVGATVTLGIRPETLVISPTEDGLRGTVDVVEHLGNLSLVYLTLSTGEHVVVEARKDANLRFGQAISLGAPGGTIHVFGPNGLAVTLHKGQSDTGKAAA